jgi:hypothetical protein
LQDCEKPPSEKRKKRKASVEIGNETKNEKKTNNGAD